MCRRFPLPRPGEGKGPPPPAFSPAWPEWSPSPRRLRPTPRATPPTRRSVRPSGACSASAWSASRSASTSTASAATPGSMCGRFTTTWPSSWAPPRQQAHQLLQHLRALQGGVPRRPAHGAGLQKGPGGDGGYGEMPPSAHDFPCGTWGSATATNAPWRDISRAPRRAGTCFTLAASSAPRPRLRWSRFTAS